MCTGSQAPRVTCASDRLVFRRIRPVEQEREEGSVLQASHQGMLKRGSRTGSENNLAIHRLVGIGRSAHIC